MLKKRLIPVLILRDGQVVQSVQFKHTNVIHWNPSTAVDFFNNWAVDEIVLLDVSRTRDKRDLFLEATDMLSHKCFVPLAAGGWIADTDEMARLLRLGADKIVVNTEAFRDPELIAQGARSFGSQCIVVSIDVWKDEQGLCEVRIDRGAESTGRDPVDWAREAQDKGAGEIMLNCIQRDGFRKGYDLDLLRSVVRAVDIPVIAMGGVFTWDHLVQGVDAGAEAVAAANIFHYTEHATRKAKKHMRAKGVDVR